MPGITVKGRLNADSLRLGDVPCLQSMVNSHRGLRPKPVLVRIRLLDRPYVSISQALPWALAS